MSDDLLKQLREMLPKIQDPAAQKALRITSEILAKVLSSPAKEATTTDEDADKIVAAMENTPEKRYKILLACYYLESVLKKQTYTTSDVQKTFKELRIPINTNISQHLKELKDIEMVVEVKTKDKKQGKSKRKHWQLTRAGIRKAKEMIETGGTKNETKKKKRETC